MLALPYHFLENYNTSRLQTLRSSNVRNNPTLYFLIWLIVSHLVHMYFHEPQSKIPNIIYQLPLYIWFHKDFLYLPQNKNKNTRVAKLEFLSVFGSFISIYLPDQPHRFTSHHTPCPSSRFSHLHHNTHNYTDSCIIKIIWIQYSCLVVVLLKWFSH